MALEGTTSPVRIARPQPGARFAAFLAHPFPWLILAVALLFAFLPLWGGNVQLRESLLLAAVYITLASNLNLMIGYAGYVNFGNIVFFGLGGYICVVLVSALGLPLIVAVLAAGLSVSALALLFGLGILGYAARSSRSRPLASMRR